jgi:hypothetical protein
MARFSYYISPLETPLSPASAVWQESLPLARPTSGKSAQKVVSHGEYFDAIRFFFEQDGCEMFSRILAQRLQQTILAGDIEEIRLHLEKHGEFYHPARIETDVVGRTVSFVLNVALSDPGKTYIKGEFHNLKKLNAEFAESFLPQVYTLGEVTSGSQKKFWMFLGDWLKNYYEFHLSRDTSDNRLKLAVWDDTHRHFFLSLRQSAQLYRQVARILAYYYDVTTFEQIFSWHHAAGDFVIRINRSEIDVKLITVRHYKSFLKNLDGLEDASHNPEMILQALLIFFLSLGIRTRLDRLDGVGDLVWADSVAVGPTLIGFMEGLALKPPVRMLPDTIERCFRYYLAVCSRQDFYELSNAVVGALHPQAPEIPVIKQNLTGHIETLHGVVQQMCN